MAPRRKPAPSTLIPPAEDYQYFEIAADHPFRPNASGFDPVNAAWLADASFLAYGSGDFVPTRVPASLGKVHPFDRDGTGGFVLIAANFIMVAFRGTQIDRVGNPLAQLGQDLGLLELAQLPSLLFVDPIDAFTDAQFVPGLEGTHSGFQRALITVWDNDVRPLLDDNRHDPARPIWFTGHSLGGALATLAAKAYGAENVQGLYTFGSPRVGDERFAKAFHAPCIRFVHADDLVTGAPPAIVSRYRHVGDPVMHVTPEGNVLEAPGLKDLTLMPLLPSILDHAPIHYANKLSNFLGRHRAKNAVDGNVRVTRQGTVRLVDTSILGGTEKSGNFPSANTNQNGSLRRARGFA